MDTFVDSSWYFLRYVDPHNDEAPFDRRLVDYWCPIDHYIGGIDHATGHLLYSRFFVKVMNEMGMLGFREPFARLFHQGWVTMGGTKMSKSKGNVAGPDDVVDAYGADAVRLYILFMGPADQDMEWTDSGIEGIARFVRRLWRVVHEVAERRRRATRATGRSSARRTQTIAKVTDDIDRRMQFHTPISAVMELVNELADDARGARRALRRRDGGVAAPAVGAARHRGAVGGARPQSGCGSSRGRWPTRRCSSATRSSSSSR